MESKRPDGCCSCDSGTVSLMATERGPEGRKAGFGLIVTSSSVGSSGSPREAPGANAINAGQVWVDNPRLAQILVERRQCEEYRSRPILSRFNWVVV